MKKEKRILTVLLLLPAIISCLCLSAYADASVTYSSDSHEFIISADGVEGTSDLFGEMFKGMMPGDSTTETVTVANISKKTTVKLYMRLDYLSDSERAMLKAVSITVSNENGVLFNKPAGTEFPSSAAWTYLCMLSAGSSSIMNIKITAPVQMGNQYQNADADIVWRFKVEEGSVSSDVTTDSTTRTTTTSTAAGNGKSGVKTGDDGKLVVYIMPFLISSAAIPTMARLLRREHDARRT